MGYSRGVGVADRGDLGGGGDPARTGRSGGNEADRDEYTGIDGERGELGTNGKNETSSSSSYITSRCGVHLLRARASVAIILTYLAVSSKPRLKSRLDARVNNTYSLEVKVLVLIRFIFYLEKFNVSFRKSVKNFLLL